MRLFFLLLLLLPSVSFSQVLPSLGVKFYHLKSGDNYYNYNVAWYNDINETYDYYAAHSSLGPLAGGINLRSYGRQFLDSSRFSVGYSLGIGINQFRSETYFVYAGSSTADPDSIINAHGDFRFKTDFSTVYFYNYLDVHWNLSDKVKWTNSLGVGLKAMLRAKARDFPYHEAVMIDNDRPVILTFAYETMITERYRKVDVGYFISFTPFGLPLFDEDADNPNGFDDRHKLSKIRFNSIGIRVIPHPKKKKLPNLNI